MTTLPIVKATNVTTFRNTIKKQLDMVTNDHVSLIVTRNEDKNVVVLSEIEYENMIKLINNLRYEKDLLESYIQAKKGEVISVDLNDLMTHEE